MARKRKGRAVNGILLLDKPVGLSSNQAMQRVRWLFHAEKAGHGGTLDPFADGLLPILLGDATKFGRFLLDADKSYRVTLAFGRETDTDDHTGETIRTAAIPEPQAVDWQQIMAQFSGQQQQVPPVYSALKIGGERAYHLARKGELPEMAAREITVKEISLVNQERGTATLDVRCSKGTYIRSLVRDIGRALGSAAHAQALRRTAVGTLQGGFHPLASLTDMHQDALDALLLPVNKCVESLPQITIPQEKLRFFVHGNDVALATGRRW